VKTLVRIVNITAKDKFAICPDSRVRSQLPELNRQTQKGLYAMQHHHCIYLFTASNQNPPARNSRKPRE
jgi:hypothetical protein